MELIIPFPKTDFTEAGEHIMSGKIIYELQKEWEESYHNKFNPYYANMIEGHPIAMYRLTKYYEMGEPSSYDFGMELVDGEIDIDTNLEIEKYTETETVYAIGSQLQLDEDGDGEPIMLIRNDKIKEDILVLRYVSDNDNEDEISIETPVEVMNHKS